MKFEFSETHWLVYRYSVDVFYREELYTADDEMFIQTQMIFSLFYKSFKTHEYHWMVVLK